MIVRYVLRTANIRCRKCTLHKENPAGDMPAGPHFLQPHFNPFLMRSWLISGLCYWVNASWIVITIRGSSFSTVPPGEVVNSNCAIGRAQPLLEGAGPANGKVGSPVHVPSVASQLPSSMRYSYTVPPPMPAAWAGPGPVAGDAPA